MKLLPTYSTILKIPLKEPKSELDIKGLFDDLDVNSNKLGNTVAKRNEKLVKILEAIGGGLRLGNYAD